MKKRILSFLLVLSMILPLLPALPVTAEAVEEVTGDFMKPVTRITWEDPIPEGYIPISTEAELKAISSNPSGNYILMADIEFTDFEPLCSKGKPFEGVFEGNGHTISGINTIETISDRQRYHYYGLFAATSNARITNLRISGFINITDSNGEWQHFIYIGGLIGYADEDLAVVNCVNNVRISLTSNRADRGAGGTIGGLIGYYSESGGSVTVDSCKNIANLIGCHNIGGLIGIADIEGDGDFTIQNCRNNGEIKSAFGAFWMGGIVGEMRAEKRTSIKIYACINTGSVDGKTSVGGILGGNNSVFDREKLDAVISSCVNAGEISGSMDVGGIAGDCGNMKIQDCLNTGTVQYINGVRDENGHKLRPSFGGISGPAESVMHCINVGNVTGYEYNSAIAIPWYRYSETVDENDTDRLSNCYWMPSGDTNTYFSACYQSGAGFITAKKFRTEGKLTPEEMAKEESFVGFSFPEVWTMDEERGYPFPTALLDQEMEDTYEQTYIANTKGLLEDHRYVTLMGGSGDGSFAGILGEQYEQAALDEVNNVWKAATVLSDLAELKVPDLTTYDILMADLLMGSVSKNTMNEQLLSETLNNISNILTAVNKVADTETIQVLEFNLEAAANRKNFRGDTAMEILQILEETGLNKVPIDKIGKGMEKVGSAVSIAQATAKGVEKAEDAYKFYVLCQSHEDFVKSYGDLLLDVGEEAKTIDTTYGESMYKAAKAVADEMHRILVMDGFALFDNILDPMYSAAFMITASRTADIIQMAKWNKYTKFASAGVLGFTLGVSMANSLTKMDKIAYYGRMMAMCELFAKSLHAEVLDRQEAFIRDETMENAKALNYASNLYVNTQLLACEYAYGYSNAIASSGLSRVFHVNMDDVAACIQLQCLMADLMKLRDDATTITIGRDGSINGFVANCPVTIDVTDAEGGMIAHMETGKLTTADGYGGTYLLLGEEGEHKAGMYNPDEHTMTITGEADGTMDLVLYYAEKGELTQVDTYLKVPVKAGERYIVTDSGLENGETLITPTKTEIPGEEPPADPTEPEVTEPEETEPEVTEPEVTEPEETEPEETEPEVTEPEETEPEETEPEETEPEVTEPEESGTITRIAGTNRISTAIASANKLKEVLGVAKFDTILVANAMDFPDALSGSYLAAAAKAPILLYANGQKSVTDYIRNNLASGGIVYILGGEKSVSNELITILDGIECERVAGSGRFATSLAIIRKADELRGTKPDKVLICHALAFADSLSASATGLPILLVNGGGSLNADQKAYLESVRGAELYVIGGPNTIAPALLEELNAYDADGAERVYGSGRELTSAAVAKTFFPEAKTAALASSLDFPDGLSGGPVAYALGAPLLLTREGKEAAAKAYVTEKAITTSYIIGGASSVTDAAAMAVFGADALLK